MKTIQYKNMTSRFIKLTVLMAIIVLVAGNSYGQRRRSFNPKHTYIGMEGGFGIKSFTVTSNIPQIDQLFTSKAGGNLGFIIGRSAVKFPISVGMYYQSIMEKRTIDIFSVRTAANVSLMHLAGLRKSKFDVYTVSGLNFQNFTFMGTYIQAPEGQSRRMVMGEPLLGNVAMFNADLGLGMEYRLRDDFAFVDLFFEATKVYNISTGTSSDFAQTSVASDIAFNLGLRIGAVK